MKKTFLVALMLMLFLGAGCFNSSQDEFLDDLDNPIITTEYFVVKLFYEKGYAIICEFTELGREQEILVIPSHVEGLPVTQISDQAGYGDHCWSVGLRKVYLPYTISKIEKLYSLYAPMHKGDNLIFVLQQVYPATMLQSELKLFLSMIYYEQVIFFTDESIENEELYYEGICPPNIVYYLNYEETLNNGCYWLDFINADNLYVDPVDPVREGYEFTGWYQDAECLVLWDNIRPQTAEEIVELYAGWQEIN